MKLIPVLSLILLSGWRSETGTEVVSSQETIVRTSLEATQVLQSDTLGLFYGTNVFGGAVNYSSTDSGGVLSFKNVTSSQDVITMKNNQMLSWVTTNGVTKKFGVSSDNRFVVRASVDAEGYNASFDKIKATSIDVTEFMAAGSHGITSNYTVNTGGAGDPNGCQLTFKGGILISANC